MQTTLSPGELDRFRALLKEEEARQRRLVGHMTERGLDAPMSEAVGELSSFDQHTADAGAEMHERERDFGVLLTARECLDRIDAALGRIERGTYGRCEVCGEPIPRERLEALPYAECCVPCSEARERERESDRLAAERSLSPPFASEPADGAVDGEDVWQELAQWGTANSPQDDLVLDREEP